MKWIGSLLKWLNQDQRYMHLGTSVLLVIIGLLCIIDSHRLVRLIHILLTLYFLVSTIFALIRLPKYHDHDALLR